jgi:hypothetical protein
MKEYEKKLRDVEKMEVAQPEEESPPEEPEFVLSREELMSKLDAAGVEYNKKSHAKTLRAMVEKLESEEKS